MNPWLFSLLNVIGAIIAVDYLHSGPLARTLILAITCITGYFGPSVFEEGWYHQGYLAGIVIGSVAGAILERGDAKTRDGDAQAAAKIGS